MAEFGTGCGVGTAWLRSGVRNGARILTAELDESLAGAAAKIFDDDAKVEVLAADWNVLRDRGPFSLLFLDSGTPSEVGVDHVVDLVEPGGIVVLDDFAPCESWPPITYGRVDTPARAVAHRRALHRGRGHGGRRRVRRHRDPPLSGRDRAA